MKKSIKKVIFFSVLVLLIMKGSAIKASDSEEPKFPKGVTVPNSMELGKY